MTVPVTVQTEEWENKGISWYYENLGDADRKKIRQAMDYAIPRQQIINTVMHSLAVPLATEIGQNMMGYDPSIRPREYNITRAKTLLAEVFGKIYNNSPGVEANSTHTTIPYFRMILIVPTDNSARIQWIKLIDTEFQNIGIDTTLKFWNWNIIMPRLFLDPIQDPIGADYAHGGYDAYFVGFDASADPDYSSRYYPSQFAPNGSNTQWIENEEVVEIINRSLTSPALDDRLRALKDFQAWFYEWVPKSIILQAYNIYAVDPYLEGLDTYLSSNFENCTIIHPINGSQDTLTYTIPGNFVAFNPLLSNNYYDSIVARNIFNPLVSRRGAYNLTHPVGVLAESWTSSDDGLVWEVKLREGVQWHDGTEVTADDVVFSYQTCFEEELGSPKLGFMQDLFGKNKSSNIEKIDKFNVRFTLESFYPYVTKAVFSLSILQKAQMEQIDFVDWKTHGTNTGTVKLIGCGPYEFNSFYNPNNVILIKSDHYNQGRMGHDPDALGGGIWWPNASIETINVCIVSSPFTAVTGLKGTYDIIDPRTGIQSQYDELLEAEWADIIISLQYGWEELAYNHYDPKWGINPHILYGYQPPPDYKTRNNLYFFFSLLPLVILIPVTGIKILQKVMVMRKE